jgi:hypothetical protein
MFCPGPKGSPNRDTSVRATSVVNCLSVHPQRSSGAAGCRAQYGDAAALHQPAGDGYLTLSWKQYLRAVMEIAAGLRSLGIAKARWWR